MGALQRPYKVKEPVKSIQGEIKINFYNTIILLKAAFADTVKKILYIIIIISVDLSLQLGDIQCLILPSPSFHSFSFSSPSLPSSSSHSK